MDWLMPVALSLGIIVVVIALAALGWRGRLARQRDVTAPPEAPETLSEPHYVANGQYVVTTTAGDWLDRIAVHGLGVKSNATASVARRVSLAEGRSLTLLLFLVDLS